MAKYKKKSVVDIGLTALCLQANEGQTLTLKDIADVCECRKQTILKIQNDALIKLRKMIDINDHLEA